MLQWDRLETHSSAPLRLRSHSGTMASARGPIIHPYLADSIGALNELRAGRGAVFDKQHDAGIEGALGRARDRAGGAPRPQPRPES